jgi:hypothetical protein
MKKLKGFTGIQIIGMLLAAAALVGAIAGLVYGVTSYLEGVRKTADKAGYDRAMKEVGQRDLKALSEATDEIVRLNKEARARELEHAKVVANLNAKLKKEKENAKAAESKLLADLDAGALVLRDDVLIPAACPAESGAPQGSGGRTAAPSADPKRAAGKTCWRFSPDVEKTLVEIGGRADRYAASLTSCVALLEEDRKVVNVP